MCSHLGTGGADLSDHKEEVAEAQVHLASMALVDWKSAIKTSQEATVEAEVLTKITTFFINAGFKHPSEVVGMVKEDFRNGVEGIQWPTEPMEVALARRVLLHVNTVAETERQISMKKKLDVETKDELSKEINERREQSARLFGSEANALDLAKALATEEVKKTG